MKTTSKVKDVIKKGRSALKQDKNYQDFKKASNQSSKFITKKRNGYSLPPLDTVGKRAYDALYSVKRN